jgi:alkane 1-monooxygenase
MSRSINAIKYTSVFTLPLTVYIAFTQHGLFTYLPMFYVFGLVPSIELLFKPDTSNMDEVSETLAKKDSFYDILLYLVVPVQFYFIYMFCNTITEAGLLAYESIGRVLALGLMCGTFGINVAHELGHRKNKYEQLLAKILLLSSLYMHFFIEHNRGHHKNVSTPEDPATSHYGQWVYLFWLQSIVGSYLSAWSLENKRLKKMGKNWLNPRNEMLQFTIIQLGLCIIIFAVFGVTVLIAFLWAALMGILLLETVNYIEHYGLRRKKINTNRYERVLPAHSWNSDHIIGRLLLFELSRHSDHHYNASRKYQILKHHENSPQMPTGYPGMMLLSLIPPLWFLVMHRRIKRMNSTEMV